MGYNLHPMFREGFQLYNQAYEAKEEAYQVVTMWTPIDEKRRALWEGMAVLVSAKRGISELMVKVENVTDLTPFDKDQCILGLDGRLDNIDTWVAEVEAYNPRIDMMEQLNVRCLS